MTTERPGTTAETLPVLPLRSTAVFPLGVVGVQIGSPSTLEMLTAHPEPGLMVAAVVAPGDPDEPIDLGALEKIAVAARVSDRLNLPGGIVQTTLQGLHRVHLSDLHERDGYYIATYKRVRERAASSTEARDLIARILNTLEALSTEVERIPREVPRILRMNLSDPGRFADLVAILANFSVASKDRVLQTVGVRARLRFEFSELESQLARVRRMAEEAEDSTHERPAAGAKPARAADLRQQIKVLQMELGDIDPVDTEVVDLLRRIESAGLPSRALVRARAEIERLHAVGAASPEAGEIRAYVDWLLQMPWRRSATAGPSSIDLRAVQEHLDRALLGLTEQKERLLDHLAVARLRGDLDGPIPCLVGPPDAGKISLTEALATGLGRPLAQLDLGGRSESQLVGVRRARGGAQPGRIATLLRDVRVNDPVLVLGEMDEIGLGNLDGDPIEALEEVLDQRTAFVDHYLDVPFDLSSVLFIALAHDFHKVPRNLRERMVEIRIAGYTPEEKVEIARSRMIPSLIKAHGLRANDVTFDDDGLYALAYGYARDAGVGTLRRAIETLLRTRARARAQGDHSTWKYGPVRIEQVLGVPRYVATPAESQPEVGVVTGLAWTASGGELMFIEALRMPGSGRLIITGMLGDVMRESVNAAYSYVRSRGEDLGITEDGFRGSDVHVHFPVGAIPKDGPSAGVAVTLAIASTLANRPVRHDIAMTGEVTLRGKILEVGGIKEKVLAAHRAKIRNVILPRGNERDLRDVPDDVRTATAFHFVDRMDDVVNLALFEIAAPAPPVARIADQRREPRAARKRS